MAVALVMPSAGTGSRFGGDIPKQLLSLHGRVVLCRSLAAFADQVDYAVIPIDPAIEGPVTMAIEADPPPFPWITVTGGATRQASVYAGIAAVPSAFDVVLVHDAARPLVRSYCIEGCIEAVLEHGAAVVCQACSSTVKKANTGMVETTVPRSDLWLAQTPQGFRRELGLAAFGHAAAEGWVCTDDAEVLERYGVPVAIVEGDASNLKLTTPDDWAVAEALAARDEDD